ncbi:MAG TPA: penicillin-binding protein activator [candidate division Zixibacteria bacterium]
MLKKPFIFLLILAILITAYSIHALAQAPENEFKQALSLYSDGNYKEARVRFEKLISTYPADEHLSIFKFMLSKCDYYLGDYILAQSGFRSFVTEFPQSLYLGDAHFMLGNIDYLEGNKFEAAVEYLKAYDYAENEELKGLAYNSLIPLLKVGLSLSEHDRLVRQSRGRKLADEVLFQLAQRELERKNFAEAKDFLEQYIENYPEGSHLKEAEELLKPVASPRGEYVSKPTQDIYPRLPSASPRGERPETSKIGVLVPLSGVYQTYGENLLKGIKLAVAKYYPQRIELTVKDTQENPIVTAHKTKELIEENGVIAIIGPLKSDCAASAAAVANCLSVPLVCPAVSEEGITTLGKYIFQLSTSTEKMGRAMAHYATTSMGLTEFVILAPDDSYGRNTVSGFEEEVKHLGGKIAACQFYSRESTDFGNELRAIRDILFKEKEKREGGIDTTKYVDIQGKPLPLDAIPVQVDGFFLPGYSEDVILIAPQIAFTKIETHLLGSEGWKNKRIIELSGDYVQKAVFVSDSYEDENDSSDFVSSYEKTYAEKPDKVAVLGYDSIKFLGLALEGKSWTSQEIGDCLSKVKDFDGASGKFLLNPQHENESFSIFTIEGKKFKKLE